MSRSHQQPTQMHHSNIWLSLIGAKQDHGCSWNVHRQTLWTFSLLFCLFSKQQLQLPKQLLYTVNPRCVMQYIHSISIQIDEQSVCCAVMLKVVRQVNIVGGHDHTACRTCLATVYTVLLATIQVLVR